MRKKNTQKTREERKEILRLLNLLKKYSQRTGREFPKRDCYIETYIAKYQKGDLVFSRNAFAQCDEQKSVEIEKLEAVPSYMANSFRPFVEAFFNTEGINEPYRLEILPGYAVRLLPHNIPSAPPLEDSKTRKVEAGGLWKTVRGIPGQLYSEFVEIIRGAFRKPEEYAKKCIEIDRLHYLALPFCALSLYFSLEHLSNLFQSILLYFTLSFSASGNHAGLNLVNNYKNVEVINFSLYSLIAQLIELAGFAWIIQEAGKLLFKAKAPFIPIFNFFLGFSAVWIPILNAGVVYFKFNDDAGISKMPPTLFLGWVGYLFYRNQVYATSAMLNLTKKRGLVIVIIAMAIKIFVLNKIMSYSPFTPTRPSFLP